MIILYSAIIAYVAISVVATIAFNIAWYKSHGNLSILAFLGNCIFGFFTMYYLVILYAVLYVIEVKNEGED